MSTTPSIATRYTARYRVRHPFACAGLAFAGMTPDLAIAVSKAGGIGSLGGFTPPMSEAQTVLDRLARAQG